MIRTLAADLGFPTVRSIALAAATLAGIVLALTVSPSLWGAAVALAAMTGAAWDREVLCDDCGESLETRSH